MHRLFLTTYAPFIYRAHFFHIIHPESANKWPPRPRTNSRDHYLPRTAIIFVSSSPCASKHGFEHSRGKLHCSSAQSSRRYSCPIGRRLGIGRAGRSPVRGLVCAREDEMRGGGGARGEAGEYKECRCGDIGRGLVKRDVTYAEVVLGCCEAHGESDGEGEEGDGVKVVHSGYKLMIRGVLF